MNNFVDASGQAIPDESLADAFTKGEASALPGTRVHMLDPSGKPVTLPAEEAGKALGAGYQPEPSSSVQARHTEKRFSTTGEQIKTGAEGVARGATFGLSDVAIGALDDEWRANALNRQQVNPVTAGVSEVAGAIAPALLSGGASAEASLASRALTAPSRLASSAARRLLPLATAETAMGRMMMRAAQGATVGALEGLIYGAGSTAGDAALKNDEITVEKILSGGAKGALVGGILGGITGGIAGKFERPPAQIGDDLLMRQKIDKMEARLRKAGESEERIAQTIQKETARLEKKASRLDEFAAKQAIGTLEPSPGMRLRYAKSATDVDQLIREAGTDYLSYEMRSGPLQGERIFKAAKDPIDLVDDIGHAWKETDNVLATFRNEAKQAMVAAPDLRPDMGALSRRIETDVAEVAANKRVAKDMVARYTRPMRDSLLEGVDPLSALEQTRAGLSDALESATRPEQIRTLQTIRRAVDDTITEATEAALGKAGMNVGMYRQEARLHRSLSFVRDAVDQLAFAAKSSGADNSLMMYAAGAALGGNFGLGAAAGAAKMLGLNWLRSRAGGLVAELAHRVSKADFRLDWGAKALAGDPFRYPVRSTVTRALSGGSADRFYSALAVLNSDPKAREDYAVRATKDVAEQYPELTMQMQRELQADIQYLAANMPMRYSDFGATMTPAATKPIGNRTVAAEFWEKLNALEDPGYVVDEMLHGRVPTAAIEALKERRRHIWERLRMQVATEVAARPDELPLKRRITLGRAFDFLADKSMLPGRMQAIQDSLMPAQAPGPPPSTGAIKAQSGTIDSMSLPGDEL